MASDRHSDKVGERFYHIAVPLAVGILGYIIAISTMNTAARYVSLFVCSFTITGDHTMLKCYCSSFLMSLSYCGFIVMFAWISNSFPRPPSKRAVALAFTNCFSQLGNVAGSSVSYLLIAPQLG